MSGHVHNYASRLEWSGATADGYEHYDRRHTVSAPPSPARLELSSDVAFRGDPELVNPEQLLVVAASSCQLLSFLAIAARARINVVAYTDEAEAVMPEETEPMRITRITLRPRIVIDGPLDEARVRRYVELAHEHCFIANSVTTEIVLEPRIESAGDS
jgi:organic hydroperoxide reductase OsmC/OhrA